MALIPTLSRQRGIPATTGVPAPPVVTIRNKMEGAARFFEQLGKEGVKLTAAQTATEMAVAESSAILKFRALEAELAKEDGLVAPTLYEVKAKQIYEDVSLGLTTPAAQRLFQNKFSLLSVRSKVAVTTAGLARKKDQLWADVLSTNDTLVDLIGQDISPRMRSGIHISVMKNIDDAVKAGTTSPTKGANEKIRLRSVIAKNGIAAWINRATKDELLSRYDQLNAGKFTGLNAEQNGVDWKHLTELEKDSIRRKVARELESLTRLAEKQDRATDRELKKKQEDNFGETALIIQAVKTGQKDFTYLPTISEIDEMKDNRDIDGQQAKVLGDMLVDVDQAKTDRLEMLGLQNDIYAIADLDFPFEQQDAALTAIRNRIFLLARQGRLEISHTTALTNLMAKIKDKTFATSPQVRARVSLRRILGAGDPEFQMPGFNIDPESAARIQFALNEYDVRVDGGEKPWLVHRDLLVRARGELPLTLKRIVRPMFGPKKSLEKWTQGDVEQTTDRLIDALRNKSISNGAYNSSMGYLSQINAVIAQDAQIADEQDLIKESVKEMNGGQGTLLEDRKK